MVSCKATGFQFQDFLEWKCDLFTRLRSVATSAPDWMLLQLWFSSDFSKLALDLTSFSLVLSVRRSASSVGWTTIAFSESLESVRSVSTTYTAFLFGKLGRSDFALASTNQLTTLLSVMRSLRRCDRLLSLSTWPSKSVNDGFGFDSNQELSFASSVDGSNVVVDERGEEVSGGDDLELDPFSALSSGIAVDPFDR